MILLNTHRRPRSFRSLSLLGCTVSHMSYAYDPELAQIYWEHTHKTTVCITCNLLQARISYSHVPALGGSWEMIYIDMQMHRLHVYSAWSVYRQYY